MTLTKASRSKWLENTKLFLAPLLVLYLLYVQSCIRTGGITWSDFVPTEEVIGGILLYAINVALDYLRKVKK